MAISKIEPDRPPTAPRIFPFNLATSLYALIGGCISAWVISFFQISNSNHQLKKSIDLISNAGHRVVPTGDALSSLTDPASALWGALFLVLTAGLSISTLSMAINYLLRRIVPKRNTRIAMTALIWIPITGFLVFIGESLWSQLYTTIIPLITLLILERKTPSIPKKHPPCPSWIKPPAQQKTQTAEPLHLHPSPLFFWLVFIITFILVAGLFYVQCDKSIFLRTRDTFLLNNRIGNRINQFYYAYTLYAAQAIQSPIQKQIKSCWIDPALSQKKRIQGTLAQNGWLDIPDKRETSVWIQQSDQRFLKNELVIITADQLIKNPRQTLEQISNAVDDQAIMRKLCLFGLMGALPLTAFFLFFVSIHFSIQWGINRLNSRAEHFPWKWMGYFHSRGGLIHSHARLPWKWIHYFHGRGWLNANHVCLQDRMRKAGLASASIMVLTLSFLIVETLYPPHPAGQLSLIQGHDSKNEFLYPRDVAIDLPNTAVDSHTASEKYWIANLIGKKGDIDALPYLKRLATDPSINVRCSAIRAIGIIGRNMKREPGGEVRGQPISDQALRVRNMTQDILRFLDEQMTMNHHWYVQRAIYEAIGKIK